VRSSLSDLIEFSSHESKSSHSVQAAPMHELGHEPVSESVVDVAPPADVLNEVDDLILLLDLLSRRLSLDKYKSR
jgi:hypothetical protein